MMNKTILRPMQRTLTAAGLAACLLLASCGAPAASGTARQNAASSDAGASQSASAASASAAQPGRTASSSASVSPQAAGLTGVYVLDDANTLPEYLPQITFFADGTFAFIENLYEGMGCMSGTFTADAAAVQCTVTQSTFSGTGFAGGDAKGITLLREENGALQLQQDICYSMAGNRLVPADADLSVIGRVFVSKSPNFSAGYEPTLTLAPDGSFTMRENLLEGMGSYTGCYDVRGKSVRCFVHTCDFNNNGGSFAGADVGLIGFSLQEDGTLRLDTDLCGSVYGDRFAAQQ